MGKEDDAHDWSPHFVTDALSQTTETPAADVVHYCRHHGGPRGPEAADEITRLRAYEAELRKTIDWQGREINKAIDRADELQRRLDEAVKALAERVCRDVAELPDRSSPDDWPEAMLVTHDELALIVEHNITSIRGEV